jgi:hypothetical protein
MENENKNTTGKRFGLKLIFSVFVITLFFSFFQDISGFFGLRELQGAYVETEKPVFSFGAWFKGDFQSQAELYLNEKTGMKPLLVGINNEIDFRFYKQTNAKDIIIGKKNYLFEENYIDAWTGKDFIGLDKANDFADLYEKAHRILAENGVELIFVFAPGKATYHPEYIPDTYIAQKQDETNYGIMSNLISQSGFNTIDFNNWFLEMKDTASYPLFPKAGIHWSYYGVYMCADSLISFIDDLLDKDIPEIYMHAMERDYEQRHTDYDLGNLMNLLCKIPGPEMAYPQIAYITENKYRPDVLVIGDSFYWNLYYSGIPSNVFKSLDFWYYNSSYYNDGTDVPVCRVNEMNFAEQVFNRDAVIIMQTDGGLGNFGFGFLQDVIINEDSALLQSYIDRIRNDDEWMHHIEEKALENSISVEEMLIIDAKYMMQLEASN